ncbi:zinc finger protein ZFP2-like [Malaya genurostris]|uniref:zinc finger protein ZFP2-like n=1 Tax=Malaya genurostris TaxID=325434 RepID=UPI0026F3BD1A|nr:zinc finger protein ZFP2-like [Malaya genurostris]
MINMACPFEKRELSCKICEGTNGAMESMFCDPNDDRLLNKIFKCTDVKVKPVYGIISPICEFCRSRIELFDDNFQPQCKEYVVEKVDTKSVAPDDDPFNCLEPIEIKNDKTLDYLEIKEEHSKEANVREVKLQTIFRTATIEIKTESEWPQTDFDSKFKITENINEIKEDPNEFQENEESSAQNSCDDNHDQDSGATESEMSDRPRKTKREQNPKSDTAHVAFRIPTKCEICGKVVTYMKDHMRLHSGNKKFKCPYCDRSFLQSNNLVYHVRKHTGEKPFPCDKCDKSFICKSHLLSHSRLHANDQPYVCEFCSKRFNQACNLTKHLRIHSGEKPYKCEVCNKAFMNLSNKKGHEKRHRGEKNFSCEVCSKSFYDNHHLERHISSHTNDKQFECNFCLKKFSSASSLKNHKSNHKPLMEKINCSTCAEEFTSIKQLKRHMKSHRSDSESPLFPCHVCLMTFTSTAQLEKHDNELHSGSFQNYSKQNEDLVINTVSESTQNVGSGKSKTSQRATIIDPTAVNKQLESGLTKPFRCDVCYKQFTRARSLKVHCQVHISGNKLFKCDKCSRSFTRKEQLIIHDRTHTGSRPFVCEFCSEQFIKATDLKRHQIASHNGSSIQRKKKRTPEPLAGTNVITQLIELPPEVLPDSDQVLIKFEIKNV